MDGEHKNMGEEAVGSGKRLFSPEDSHSAKRTGIVSAIYRTAGRKACTPLETIAAKQCLPECGFETEGLPGGQSSELCSWRANQLTLMGVQQNTVTWPEPHSEQGGLPREESAFTLIREQRGTGPEVGVAVPSPQRTKRPPSTVAGGLAVMAHIDDLVKGAAGAIDPAPTSSQGDGCGTTSPDLGQSVYNQVAVCF